MAICRCSPRAVLLALVLPAALAAQEPPPADSLAAWWARVRADSTDARAWLSLGQAYVARASLYHSRHRAPDSAEAPAALDSAQDAFLRAAQGTGALRDTALVFRVFTWGEAALLAWERGGIEAAARVGAAMPPGLRLPPVVAELGENLLRACPDEGVLLTADDVDTYAAWFLRFGRGLRPDLLILPWQVWRTDPVLRERLADELRLPRAPTAQGDETAVLRAIAQRRPLCASIAFAQPPGQRPRLDWRPAPLVWLAGPEALSGTAAPGDFTFEAARMARDAGDAWAAPVLGFYRRAAGTAPALCVAFETFELGADTGCRRAG